MSCFVVSADDISSGTLLSLLSVCTFRVPIFFPFFPFSNGTLVVGFVGVGAVSVLVWDSVVDFSTAT